MANGQTVIGLDPRVDVLWRLLATRFEADDTRYGEVIELQRAMLGILKETWPRAEYLESTATAVVTPDARRSAVASLRHALHKVQENFGDLEARLHFFMKLKENAKKLCEVEHAIGEKYSAQTSEVLYDALRFCHAEDLEQTQLQAVQSALKVLENDSLKVTDAIAVDRMLSEVGLDSIPGDDGDGQH